MDKLRKIGGWFWLNKERMVLGIMVCVLVWQVYKVLFPPPREEDKPVVPPVGNIDKVVTKPPIPPPPPRPDLPVRWTFDRTNPFWLHARGGGGSSSDGRQESREDLGITVHMIRRAGGMLRAQISTRQARRNWYEEGEAFEAFQLISIDEGGKTVVIHSDQYNRQYTFDSER